MSDNSAIEQYQKFFENFGAPARALIIGPQDVSRFMVELKPEVPTVFVDSGAEWRVKLKGETNSIVVGDGDSFLGNIDIKLPEQKDYSDFAFVLKNLPNDIKKVETHGFLGGDPAHELMNFGEAHHVLKKREELVITFNGVIWGFTPGEWSFYLNARFSLVNFEKCEVSLEGLCDYQIKATKYVEPVTSLGLGNTAHGKVTVTSTGPFFIFGEKPLALDRPD